MNLSSSLTGFLKYLEVERSVSPKTIQNYDHYLKRFLEFAGSVNSGLANNISPSEIDLGLMQKYRLFLNRWKDPETKKPLKKVTQNYFLIALRAFLRYLHDQDQAFLPAEKIRLGKAETTPVKILDAQSLTKLLGAPDISSKHGLRDKALLETLFSTGLRVSELAHLNRNDISFLRAELAVSGKKYQQRRVFLSAPAVKWLDQYLKIRTDSFRPLFIRFQGTKSLAEDGESMRLTPRSIERIVEKYVKRSGLSVKATPHTLRYNFATDLLRSGTDIQSAKRILGLVQKGLPAKPKY